jgi:hypothetical protein
MAPFLNRLPLARFLDSSALVLRNNNLTRLNPPVQLSAI